METKEAKEIKETKEAKKKETVKIRIPRTRGEEDDVYVSVNDESYLIKRGETVEVPSYIAKIIEQRDEMLEKFYLTSRGRGQC